MHPSHPEAGSHRDGPQRAAIYVRLSEDKRQTGDNVADQERAARAIAATHGWSVVDVYNDNDRTAADPERKPRPGFDRLLADAGAGKFDVVVCRHADRLYRHPTDQLRLSQTLGPRGITIVQEWSGFPLDLATPTGVLQSGILAQVSLYELQHKSERQRAAHRAVITQGRMPKGGAVPFGYAADRLTPKEPEASMVRDAHRALLRGDSLGSVIRDWNVSGVTAPRGGRWTYSTVRGVLTRPLNAGLVFYVGHVLRGAEGLWEPLVSREDHHAVCTLLADPKRRTTDGNARKHLLAGVARCHSCQRPMKSGSVRSRGRQHLLYRCANRECPKPVSIARDHLDAEVERRLLNERAGLPVYRVVGIGTEIAEALNDVQARIDSTTGQMGDDDADVAALGARLAELKAERLRIKALPAVARLESKTIGEEWAKAEGDLQRRRELLLGHLAPGGLTITPRGVVTNRFDPDRVEIRWTLYVESPVTSAPVAAAEIDTWGEPPSGIVPTAAPAAWAQ